MAECPNTPLRKRLNRIPAKQKYKVEYSWPVLQKSKKRVEPILTSDTVSGLYDCRKHVEAARRGQAAGKACYKIDTFFSKGTEFATINAEMLFTSFLIEHNILILH